MNENDQDALRSLSKLGMGLLYQCAYLEARQKLQRAYEGYRILFGADNPDTTELRTILDDERMSKNCFKADRSLGLALASSLGVFFVGLI